MYYGLREIKNLNLKNKFNYNITKTTAIITGTLSVNSRNKMLKLQCASKREIIL